MIVKVTDETYDEFKSNGVSILDIKAEWCGPCKALSPIIEELSVEYHNNSDVKIGKLDADENRDTVQKLGIRSIPTIIFYKNGEIVDRHTGMIQKNDLKSIIDKHLN